MKKVFLMFLVAAIILYTMFVLGTSHGRALERKIAEIKTADTDAEELQRWEKRWEARYGKKSFAENQVDS